MILFAKSESKKLSRFSDQLSMYNYSPENSNLVPVFTQLPFEADSTKPGPLSTTQTAPKTILTSSTDRLPQYRPSLLSKDSYPTPQTSSQNQAECGSLKRGYFIGDLIDILSPEIFSQAGPFRYLVDKTMKIPYRGIVRVRETLNDAMQTEQLPLCYIPYAKTLFSILRYWPDVDEVRRYILKIQQTFSSKEVDFSFLPSDILLSPELLELFSTDIFADSTPPLRFFYKLLNTPKNDILNLKAQLQNFVERLMMEMNNIPFVNRYYIWYANAVWRLLENESTFDDLKHNMAAIQPVASFDQRFIPSMSRLMT